MRNREREVETDTLIEEVNQMGSLHVDDDRHLDQRRERLTFRHTGGVPPC